MTQKLICTRIKTHKKISRTYAIFNTTHSHVAADKFIYKKKFSCIYNVKIVSQIKNCLMAMTHRRKSLHCPKWQVLFQIIYVFISLMYANNFQLSIGLNFLFIVLYYLGEWLGHNSHRHRRHTHGLHTRSLGLIYGLRASERLTQAPSTNPTHDHIKQALT